MNKQYDIIIIGAGSAGLFCAAQLQDSGLSILVLEKTSTPGNKLLLTGGSKCNVTHTGEIKELITHYGGKERQVRHALYQFSNTHFMEDMKAEGLPLRIDPDGRVLPASDKSVDVLDVLLRLSRHENVTMSYNSPVSNITESEGVYTVESLDNTYQTSRLVIAAGGMSYPHTGSEGDAYAWARSLGHKVVEPRPALANIIMRSFSLASCAGITLTDRRLTLYREDKKLTQVNGDILFTHKGLSGPVILTLSRQVQGRDEIRIALLDEADRDSWESHLQQASHSTPRTTIRNFIHSLGLSTRLIEAVMRMYQLDKDMPLSGLNKAIRRTLGEAFMECRLTVGKRADFRTAMVTQGGVALTDIDMKTMQSKLHPGLYFIGEVLDVDGDSGGYNLQWVWSSAYVAARQIVDSRDAM